MGVLETVFNSRKFDLNDDVLMEFNNYFDEKSRDYNSFCLDEEDITSLRNLVAQIRPCLKNKYCTNCGLVRK